MPVGTPVPLTLAIIMLPRRLPRLGLRPRRHAIQQHFAQGPDVIGQARGHRRGPRPPLLGRARAIGRQGLWQRHT